GVDAAGHLVAGAPHLPPERRGEAGAPAVARVEARRRLARGRVAALAPAEAFGAESPLRLAQLVAVVLQPEAERIDARRRREQVEHALGREVALRPARGAHGARRVRRGREVAVRAARLRATEPSRDVARAAAAARVAGPAERAVVPRAQDAVRVDARADLDHGTRAVARARVL